jgi:acyl-CoA thioester hydrolase
MQSMKSDTIEIRVRYGETDQMGVVHHGNYALYLEMGRIEWLRKFGLSYKKMEEEGVGLPVISLQVNFKKPAHYDDVLRVETKLRKMPRATIEFDYEIVNETNETIVIASTVLAFIDLKTKRPTRPPRYLLDVLS